MYGPLPRWWSVNFSMQNVPIHITFRIVQIQVNSFCLLWRYSKKYIWHNLLQYIYLIYQSLYGGGLSYFKHDITRLVAIRWSTDNSVMLMVTIFCDYFLLFFPLFFFLSVATFSRNARKKNKFFGKLFSPARWNIT